jgi:hypothetical protein
VLAYLSWHRPAPSIEQSAYEHALERFHRSLAHRPPSGFRGSMAFRASELPWLPVAGGSPPAPEQGRAGGHHLSSPGYEDWYLLDDWASVGVLEEAAVSQGHVSVHDKLASRADVATSAVYRLIEGHVRLADARVGVWVGRPRGHERPALEALLGDGMDPISGCVWRRCIGLGPAPEFCLLAAEAPAGVAAQRLPKGWTSMIIERSPLWRD